MAVIILLAVGADYNLLLVARLKEEIHAGINTGIIRAMGGSGSVVTAAGLVFAFTMMSFAVSELTVMAQVGTTIGMGLLFDPDRPVVHDTVDRGPPRKVVLVAPGCPATTRSAAVALAGIGTDLRLGLSRTRLKRVALFGPRCRGPMPTGTRGEPSRPL